MNTTLFTDTVKLSILTPVYNQEKLVIRMLETIPIRNDIEIIVVDDCSTDNTWYELKMYKRYSENSIVLLQNDEKRYCGGSLNRAIDVSRGKYLLQVDSDDYVDTKALDELLDINFDEDIIYISNQINNGTVWRPKALEGLCDHICLYKKSIVGETRYEENKKWGAGWDFHKAIMEKPHTDRVFGKVVYYYNFPRTGSSYDLGIKGML